MLAKAKFTTLLLLMVLAYQQNLLAQTPFWSEDFAGGIPAGWTNVDELPNGVLWTWCDGVDGAGCAQNTPNTIFASTTASNGYANVDSDAAGEVTHKSILTTTAINCTGKANVFVRFENWIGTYTLAAATNALLQVSNNGTTWVDFTVFPTLTTANNIYSGNPHISNIDITTVAAGQATVYMRWSWNANYEYAWLLDDITLTENDPTPPNDLRVNENFFAIAPNVFTPKSQVTQFGFLADVENIGGLEQTAVNLNMTITDVVSGASVYTENNAYGAIPPATIVENQLFAGDGFTPPATEAVYEGVYTISATATDNVPTNNTLTFQFAVSDTLFAKENGATRVITPAASNWDAGEPHSWAYGNSYYVTNGTGNYVRYAIFSWRGNAATTGRDLQLNLYKWADDDANGNAGIEERTLVGYATYTIVGDEMAQNLISVRLLNFDNEALPIELENNTNYILMAEYEAASDEQSFLGGSEDFDYSATVFRSEELMQPYYAGLLGVAGDLTGEEYSSVGFGRDIVPVVRLSIGANPIVGTEDVLSAANKLELSPNPANTEIKLSMELEQNQSDVQVILNDITGKRIWSQSYSDVKSANYTYNSAALSNGIYTIQVITPAGTRSLKAVVQH